MRCYRTFRPVGPFLTARMDYEIVRASAERSQLLRSYPEPTEEKCEHELKIPTAAHRAIADLVAGGYIWVMANTIVAVFAVQASRSYAVFEALVERWAGIVVSDGYACTNTGSRGRQTCLAHLRRRALGLSERQDPEVAHFGRRMLAELGVSRPLSP